MNVLLFVSVVVVALVSEVVDDSPAGTAAEAVKDPKVDNNGFSTFSGAFGDTFSEFSLNVESGESVVGLAFVGVGLVGVLLSDLALFTGLDRSVLGEGCTCFADDRNGLAGVLDWRRFVGKSDSIAGGELPVDVMILSSKRRFARASLYLAFTRCLLALLLSCLACFNSLATMVRKGAVVLVDLLGVGGAEVVVVGTAVVVAKADFPAYTETTPPVTVIM